MVTCEHHYSTTSFAVASRQWRRVPRHPAYTVSDTGAIIHHKRHWRRILRPVLDAAGDFIVCLDGTRYRLRDVFEHAFHGAPLTDAQAVRFNSRNRPDGRVDHLRWELPRAPASAD